MDVLFPYLEPPIFTNKPPPQVVVKRGSILSICCEATGSPRPRIEWSRAQQSPDLPLAFQEKGCLEVNTIKEIRLSRHKPLWIGGNNNYSHDCAFYRLGIFHIS